MVDARKKQYRTIKLYLETSIWNFLDAPDSPEKMAMTRNLFSKIFTTEYLAGFISTLVMDEISRSQLARRNILEGFISYYQPIVLEVTPDFKKLAKRYVQSNILTQRYFTDLFHLAIATVNQIDIVVSWNLRHIVKQRTIRETNTINRELGYREINIMTPERAIEHVSRT